MRLLAGALLFAAPAAALYGTDSNVVMLTATDFNEKVMQSDGPWMIEFFASWCGHCKSLAPEYEKVAKALKGIVSVGAVEDQTVMKQYGVKSFPTLKFFGGDKSKPDEFKGGRTSQGILEYVMKKVTDLVSKSAGGGDLGGSSSSGGGGGSSGGGGGSCGGGGGGGGGSCGGGGGGGSCGGGGGGSCGGGGGGGSCGGGGGGSCGGGGGGGGGSCGGGGGGGSGDSGASNGGADTVVLTDKNFDELVMGDEANVWFVKFYAPWCGHCKAIAGVWDSLATSMKGKVKVGKMDATVEKGVPGRFNVNGFPTIKLFPSGKKTESSVVDYEGQRDLSSFKSFAGRYGVTLVEVDQLLSQEQYDKACSAESATLCVIAFLPHIIDNSAKERTQHVANLKDAAKSGGVPVNYLWSEGGVQGELEEKLNLQFGFPALVAISRKKGIFVVHRGTFSKGSIRAFVLGLSAPKHLNDLPKKLPDIVKQTKWDGKDYVPEVEEEAVEKAPSLSKEEDREEL